MNALSPSHTRKRKPRLAVVVPSSNRVAEPAMARFAINAGADLYATRIRVTEISTSAGSQAQFDLDRFDAAATLLSDLDPDAVAWAGTSGSWLGWPKDNAIRETLVKSCGVPALTASSAMISACEEVGAKKIALVTPYTQAIVKRIVANFQEAGITVSGESHSGLERNQDFADLTEKQVNQLIAEAMCSAPKAEAIVILCTNVGAWRIAQSRHRGVPTILDSVAVTFWALAHAAGIKEVAVDGRVSNGDAWLE